MNNAGENPSVGAVCECPLGFTGESCQHTTDIKVTKSLYLNIHFFYLFKVPKFDSFTFVSLDLERPR